MKHGQLREKKKNGLRHKNDVILWQKGEEFKMKCLWKCQKHGDDQDEDTDQTKNFTLYKSPSRKSGSKHCNTFLPHVRKSKSYANVSHMWKHLEVAPTTVDASRLTTGGWFTWHGYVKSANLFLSVSVILTITYKDVELKNQHSNLSDDSTVLF